MIIPTLDVDLWSDEQLRDPYPCYRELRNLGPVVYIPRHDLYAVTRYDDVKAVLGDWEAFSSAQGPVFNDTLNPQFNGSLLGSDPPNHTHFRKVLERPLAPGKLKDVRGQIHTMIAEIVGAAVDRRSVEAVSELSVQLPVRLVAELVGLPSEGRDRMLDWAAAAFNAFAPAGTPRVDAAIKELEDMTSYFFDETLSSASCREAGRRVSTKQSRPARSRASNFPGSCR